MLDKDKKHLLETFQFLKSGEKEFREIFFSQMVIKKFETGQILLSEGDHCAYLPLVITGCLKIVKIAENGREITLYRIEEGESCVLSATCILNSGEFPAIAIAEVNTSVAFMPSKLINDLIKTSDSMRNFVFDLYFKRLSSILLLVEEIAFKKMDSRISKYLLNYVSDTPGSIVNITHQELAADIGTSREVVSRVLKDLENKKIISISRGKITILDIESLKKIQSF